MASPAAFDLAAAEQFPHAVARVLEQADLDQVVLYLQQLPPNIAAEVGSNLSARRWAQLLTPLQQDIPRMLEQADLNTATVLLNRVPGSERDRFITDVTDPTRQLELRRMLSYPPHCVGGTLRNPTCVLRSSATKAEALDELKRSLPVQDPAVVVIDQQSRYLGVLDPWLLLTTGVETADISRCLQRLPGLRPERRRDDVATLPIWTSHAWLPVVDRDARLLGIYRRFDTGSAEPAQWQEEVRLSDSVYEGLGELTDIVLGRSGS